MIKRTKTYHDFVHEFANVAIPFTIVNLLLQNTKHLFIAHIQSFCTFHIHPFIIVSLSINMLFILSGFKKQY